MPSPLGRRDIRSIASGMAFQFACSSEYCARLAYQSQSPLLFIDCMTLHIEPSFFNVARIHNVAKRSQEILYRNAARLKPPVAIVQATITVRFGIETYTITNLTHRIGQSLFTVTLTDELGKARYCTHTEPTTLLAR